ncbi:putative EPIDERMAL PATTERNING FACTOR-like protein [Helianthus anomalus]
MKCSPCEATLVIPPHHKMVDYSDQSSHDEDDCYYLLSWKCKCGDKLFQP